MNNHKRIVSFLCFFLIVLFSNELREKKMDTEVVFAELIEDDKLIIVRSPCIDTGDPDPQYNDPDGTRSDMGAIPAVWHKYDNWQLPPNSVDDGWKWLSFPALDDLTNADDFDGDMAQYMLADILDTDILDHIEWKPLDPQGAGLE